MAVLIGRRIHTGASSVMNKAMPKLTGTAITIASAALTSVPKIATAAPYSSVTGFQSILVTNAGPNLTSAGQAPITSAAAIPPISASTMSAEAAVTP